MAYRTEKTDQGIDLIIDGFEAGIANDPYEGLADMRNVNFSSVPKEAAVAFKNAALTLPPTGLSSVAFVAANSNSSTLSYLVVAGGGAGGGPDGGGGGAGGVVTSTVAAAVQSYAITVGTGGAATTSVGGNGTDSLFGAVATATGGGGGGAADGAGPNAGGSGGGGSVNGNATGGVGTVGQGHNGGLGRTAGTQAGAGGGGAGFVGGNGADGVGGNGGNGVASSISGASVTYGGGGGGYSSVPGTGGTGGGGAGHSPNGIAGTDGLGGGGGGGFDFVNTGGKGGSGVVVISYNAGTLTATGGVITNVGGKTIHTFSTSGTFTITAINTLVLNALNVASTTGYYNGMAVHVTSLTGGSGITNDHTYYIGNITSTSFKLYSDPQLINAITIATNGSGTYAVPSFGKPVDSVSTPSNVFDSSTGENYKWDFIVDDVGLIWYIGNGPNGTLNTLYFTGNTGHSTATTANVGAWKGYLFGMMATDIDYIKISTWLSSGPVSWTYAWQTTTSSSVGHRSIAPAINDNFYFGNASTLGCVIEIQNETFDPADATTYTYIDNALQLPSYELVTCVAQLGYTLLIGGIGNYVYPWDTLSLHYAYIIVISDTGIKDIVSTNSSAYVFAGNRGRIYLTNGSNVELFRQFPDQIANTESPYYTWGDAKYFRNQLVFGISATTNAGVAINNYAGVWSIDLNTNGLSMMNQLSTNSFAGSVPVLLPMGNVNPAGNGLYVGWVDGSNNGGIDAGSSTPYTNSESYIDTDMLPVGTYYRPNTGQQVEYKLTRPLAAGESVRMYWRGNLTDSFTLIPTSYVTGAVSGAGQVNFQKQQWVQLRLVQSSTVTTPTYTRLREARIR